MQVKLDELSLAPATIEQLRKQLTENEKQMAILQDEGMCICSNKLTQKTFWSKSLLHVPFMDGPLGDALVLSNVGVLS